MSDELKIYTGQLKYKDVDFTFIFNGDELRLIPPKNQIDEIQMNWLMKSIVKGVYIMGDPLYMHEPYLTGKCNETATNIIFLTKQGDYIRHSNEILIVKILAYIICKYDRDKIDRMSFSGPEINCIHPINQAYKFFIDTENFSNDGIITVTTKDFDATTTTPQEFKVAERNIKAFFVLHEV